MQRFRNLTLTLVLAVLSVFWCAVAVVVLVVLAVLRWRAEREARGRRPETQWHDYPVQRQTVRLGRLVRRDAKPGPFKSEVG